MYVGGRAFIEKYHHMMYNVPVVHCGGGDGDCCGGGAEAPGGGGTPGS